MKSITWRSLALSLALGVAFTAMTAPAALAADPGDDVPEQTPELDDRLLEYWGNEVREIESLQQRIYRKVDRHEFSLYFGVIPNDEFFSYYPIGARYDYFFAEDFGLELWGSYLIRANSELEDFLESQGTLLVDVPQSLQWLAGLDLLWSPLHGKFGLLTETLGHFDMHLAFGVGAIGTTVRQLGAEESRVDVSGNLGVGVRVFVTDDISLRFDYRQFFYAAAEESGGGLSHPAELSLSVSFWTAAPE